MRSRTGLALVAAGMATAMAAPAHADDLASATGAIETVCAGVETQTEIRQRDLAEAVLVAAGMLPSKLTQLVATGPGRPADYRPSADDISIGALTFVRNPDLIGGKQTGRIYDLLAVLSDHLTQQGGALTGKLVVIGAEPEGSVFAEGVKLICPGKTPLTQIAGALPAPRERSKGAKLGANPIVVRQKVEDFGVAAKDASGSFQGSYSRQRSTDLDGATTVTKTLAVRGVLGLRLAGDGEASYLFGYGDYALNRVRKTTRPIATPAANDGRAKDVDALELGLSGSVPLGDDDVIVRLSGRAGAILDFATGARRLVGGLRAEPTGIGTIGSPRAALCGFGAYSDNVFGLPIEARCSAAARIEVSEVLRAGTAKLTKADELVAIGGDVTWEFRPRLLSDGKPRDGMVGSLVYRYQRMVAGQAPDIDRFDATLKYRWWTKDLAFDLGFTYSDGTEPKSLADENKLSITIGILY